ncbi:MAG: hypothetical protein U1A78_24195 [Polyangia bacterium]
MKRVDPDRARERARRPAGLVSYPPPRPMPPTPRPGPSGTTPGAGGPQ